MRAFSTSFKESAVLRLEAREQVAAVARDLRIARKLPHEWRAAWRKLGAAGLNRKRDVSICMIKRLHFRLKSCHKGPELS